MLTSLKNYCLGLLLLGYMGSFAQDNDPVLLSIDGQDIRVSEFEAVYKKNNQVTNQKALEEYLDLYIKFRLKVRNAENLGMDTLQSFKKELAGYRKQLAEPYLSDNDVTIELIKEAYDRMQYEVKASHIMISMTPGASPQDTLNAYKRLMAIRKRIEKGEDFEKLAAELSEDPSAKENGGNLGYFSALYMVYPFETAVYKLKVGEVSMPVRTQFGYHLIKLEDKRPNRGEISVAHIMTRIPKDATEVEVAAAKAKIDEIYGKLQEGANFETLAAQFSDDQGSAKKGGMLPPFSAGKMVMEFEDASFALEKDGDISKPVQTLYGFHIIKRIRVKKIGTYEEMAGDLKLRIARDGRSKMSKKSFIKKVKEEYGFKENIARRNDFYKVLDSTLFEQKWKVEKASKLTKPMITLGDTAVKQQDFANYIATHQPRGNQLSIESYVNMLYELYVEELCTRYEDVRLSDKYPEFRMLMREYHDGILLFDLTDDLVWSKAVKDSVGLQKYYDAHKSEYMWNERLKANIFNCIDEATAKSCRKLVKSREKKAYTNEDILKMTNVTSQLNLEIESGKFSKGDNEIMDKITWEKGISENVKLNDRIYFVEVQKVLQAQPKELNEIRGIMTSAFQTQLEENWLADLKAKYPVTVHKEHLSLIK